MGSLVVPRQAAPRSAQSTLRRHAGPQTGGRAALAFLPLGQTRYGSVESGTEWTRASFQSTPSRCQIIVVGASITDFVPSTR
jgi:hypothetical protein